MTEQLLVRVTAAAKSGDLDNVATVRADNAATRRDDAAVDVRGGRGPAFTG